MQNAQNASVRNVVLKISNNQEIPNTSSALGVKGIIFYMRILFYNSTSNHFDGTKINTKTYPSYKEQFDNLTRKYPQHEFFVVSQLPASFLVDMDGNDIIGFSDNVTYCIARDDQNTPEQLAALILEQKPDIAIALTFWTEPFDWLTIKDGMIAEILQNHGVKVICNSAQTGLECFDKFRTHCILKSLGLNAAKAVYVHHWLFMCAGTKGVVKENIYAEHVLNEIKKLHYPVIIKDTVGLSSYGMQVVDTYEEAEHFLFSKRNNSDRIVEEYIPGLQFGTEIYGTNGEYFVQPPFMFSVNKYGITSPKQCIKLGPVTSPSFRLNELNKMLLSLAEKMQLRGIAQVDLVFTKEGWRIIEINPRLSGMSETYAISLRTSLPKLLYQIASAEFLKKTFTLETKNLLPTLNLKLPILTKEQFTKISKIPFVKCARQIFNRIAKQEREKGYCEIIFSSEVPSASFKDLEAKLDYLYKEFPESTEADFLETAKSMIALVKEK